MQPGSGVISTSFSCIMHRLNRCFGWVFVMIAALFGGLTAAQAVSFNVGGGTVPSGQSIRVPVQTSGFTAVSTFQFTLEWNPDVLQFNSLGTSFGVAGLTAGVISTLDAANGRVSVAWNEPDGGVQTVASGTTLFDMTFTAVGAVGSSTALRFTDSITSREVTVDFAVVSFVGTADPISVIAVPKQDPVITWPTPASIVYGSALGSSQLNASSDTAGTFIYQPAAGAVPAAGTSTLSVVFTPTDSSAFNTVSKSVNLVVNKAPLTLTADPKTRRVGESNPVFTYTAAGFVNGETASVLSTQPRLDSSATQSSSAGSYPITFVQEAAAANYQITHVAGVLTVKPPLPTVSFRVGDANPGSTTTFSVPILVDGFTGVGGAQFSIQWNPAVLEFVGVGSFGLPGLAAGNFGTSDTSAGRLGISWDDPDAGSKTLASGATFLAVEFRAIGSPGTSSSVAFGNSPTAQEVVVAGEVAIFSGSGGTVTVGPKPKQDVVITWPDPAAITYGDLLSSVQLNATASAAGSFSYTPASGALLGAGARTLTVNFTPQDPSSFNPASKTVTLTVNRAPLTARADDKTIVAGQAVLPLGVSFTGFVNGEGLSALSVTPEVTTSATSSTGAGSYPITFSRQAAAENYTITHTSGLLTITRQPVTITWSSPFGITYGTPLGSLQLNATASAPGTFTYDPPSGTVLAAGSGTLNVLFTPSDTGFYASTSKSVSLAVGKAPLTLTAQNKTKALGEVNPPLTVSASGFVNGDTIAVLNPQPVLTTTALTASAAGSYPITFSVEAAAANYTVTHVPGALTVTPPATTVSFSVAGATPGATTTFNVPVRVSGFSGVNSFRFSLQWDPAVIQYLGAVNFSLLGLSSGNLGASDAASGRLGVSWNDPDGNGKSLGDGGALMELQFKAVGSAGTSSSIRFTQTPTAQEVVAGSLPANFSSSDATISVGAKPKQDPIVTWNAPSAITYGTALGASQLNATADVAGTFTYTPAASTVLAAGNQSLTATFTPSDTTSFNSVTKTVTLLVNRAVLTITADNKSKFAGDANPVLTLAYAGFVNGDGVGALSVAPELSTSATVSSEAGIYPISFSRAGVAANYEVVQTPGNLTVNRKDVTIVWSTPASITYGTALSASVLNASAPVAGTFSYSPQAGAVLAAGSQNLVVTFTPSAPGFFNAATKTVVLSVNRAPLTVAADAKTKNVGQENPPLTFSFSGFVNGEGAGVLTQTPALATTATTSSAEGSYPITFSREATAANYSVTHVPAALTVTAVSKQDVVLTWATPADIDYGTPLSSVQLNASASASGTFSYTPAAGTVLNAADQLLTVNFTPADPTRFNPASRSVQLKVRQVALTVTAEDKSKVAGDPNPLLTLRYSGFVNAEGPGVLSTQPELTTSATSASEAGVYGITFSRGAVALNYSIRLVPGSLTVVRKDVTITWADPAAIVYGTALSSSQLSASASTAGTFTYNPPAGTILPAGSQTLTVSFTPTAGGSFNPATRSVTLSVGKAPLTVVAENKTKVAGQDNPPLTVAYAGFVNNDNASSLSQQPVLTTSATAASSEGSVPITFSRDATSGNYAITQIPGTLTISAAPKQDVLITWASPSSVVYGTALGSAQLSATASAAGSLVYTPAAGSVVPAGTQTLTVNFTPSDPSKFNPASKTVQLTVNKAALTAVAEDKTRPTGQSNPEFTVAYSGFVNNEGPAVLSTQPLLGTSATASSPGGVYPITFSRDAVAANYVIKQLPGSLTLTRQDVAITWTNPSPITYGTALGASQLSASTTVNGTFTYNPAVGAVPAAGTVVLSVSFTPSDAGAFNPATKTVALTVNKAPLTVTADNLVKTSGQVNPPLTVSFSGFVNGEGTGVLTSQPSLTTTATTSSAAGAYPITFEREAVAANYLIKHVPGTLTVNSPARKDPVLTWANPAAIVYGVALSGAQLNATADVPGTFSYTPAIGLVPTAGTRSLTVTFTPSDAAAFNVATKTVSLQVNRAALRIAADSLSRNVGLANPELTATFTGFVNNETASVLAVRPVLSTTADQASPAGAYPITFATQASSPNYQITHVDGVLNVNGAPVLTVTKDASIGTGETFTTEIKLQDDATPAAQITLQVAASGIELASAPVLTVVPNTAGASRQVSFVAGKQTGVVTLTLTATDTQGAASVVQLPVRITGSPVFTFAVDPAKNPPKTSEDLPFAPVNFSVSDAETAADKIKVDVSVVNLDARLPDGSAAASSQPLIPAGSVTLQTLGGSVGSYSLNLAPGSSMHGSATVTLTARDEQGKSTSTSFVITVTPVNDAPVIESIAGVVTGASGLPEVVINRPDTGATPSASITFSITDIDNPADQIRLTFASSDTALLPVAGMQVDSTGRKLTLSPAAGRDGLSVVTVTATDPAGGTATRQFQVRVVAPSNSAPSFVGLVTARVGQEDKSLTIPFAVEDKESPATDLVVLAVSGNTAILSQTDLDAAVPARGGRDRSLTVQPLPNQFGKVNVTLRVSDPKGASTSVDVQLDIQPVNDAPVVSVIKDVEMVQDTATPSIPFTIGDVDTPLDQLSIDVVSSNTDLIPSGVKSSGVGVVISGVGKDRSLVVRPSAGRTGLAEVRLRVSDGDLITESVFVVKVIPRQNTAPFIVAPASGSLDEDTLFGPVLVQVGDLETPRELVVSASSTDAGLFPLTGIRLEPAAPTDLGVPQWKLTVAPGKDRNGKASVVITAKDPQGLTAEARIDLEVKPVNDPPVLSPLADQTLLEGARISDLAFQITDVDSPVDRVEVQALADDPLLFPPEGLVVKGVGGARFLDLIPAPGVSGSTRITLTAKGPNGGVSTTDFQVVVTPRVNLPPTITGLPASVVINEDESLAPVAFTVGDPDEGANLDELVIEAVSSNPNLINDLSVVIGGRGAQRSVRLAPLPDQSGSAVITVRATDPKGASTSRTLAVTVRPVNDSPRFTVELPNIAIDQGQTVPEITVAVADVDNAESSLLVTASSSSDPVLLPLASISVTGRKVKLTPAQGRAGVSTVTLKVADPAQASGTASFTLTVRPLANTPPVVSPIADVRFDEGTSRTIALAISDAETALDAVQVSLSADNSALFPGSSLELSADKKSLRLTPARLANGSSRITVKATDSSGASGSVSFTATVVPVNDPPEIELLAENKTRLVMDEDSLAVLAFRVSDPDSPLASLTVRASSSNQILFPDSGLVVQSGDASVSTRFIQLKPAPNRDGTAIITLTASDSQKSSQVQIEVVVNAINDPPILTGLVDFDLLQGATSAVTAVSLTDVESAADTLKLSFVSGDTEVVPQAGIKATRSGSTWNLTVTAGTGRTGVVPVTAVAEDPNGGRTETVFLVRVSRANEPPGIVAPSTLRLNEDQPTTLASANTPGTSPVVVFSDDTTAVADLVIAVSNTNPALLPTGSVELAPLPNRPDARQLRVTPAANAFGDADITITARDRQGLVSATVVRVTVRSVNDLPVLAAIPDQTTAEDRALVIPIFASDLETPANGLAFSVASDNESLFPAGSADVNGLNLVLRPAANESGTAVVTVSVKDSDGGVASRSFNVRVTAVNDPPLVAAPADVTMQEGQIVNVPITLSDPDSPLAEIVLRAAIVSSSNPALFLDSGLVVSSNTQGKSLQIKPSPRQSGTALVSLVATDANGLGAASLPAIFRITVQHVNQTPVVGTLQPVTVQVGAAPVSVVVAASDPDGALDPRLITFAPLQGVVFGGIQVNTLTGSVAFNVVADSTAAVESQAVLTVKDSEGASAEVRFTLRVLAENRPPLVLNLPSAINAVEDSDAVSVPFVINDAETSASELVVSAESDNERLINASGIQILGAAGSRVLVLKANPNQFGSARIRVRVTDAPVRNAPANTSGFESVFTVSPVNDAPTLAFGNPGPIRVSLDSGPASQIVEQALNLGDIETASQDLQVVVQSQNTAILPNTAAAIQVLGAGATRILRLTPSAATEGAFVDVNVTVTDGGALPDGSQPATRLSATKTFRIEFLRNQHPPSIAMDSTAPLSLDEDTVSNIRSFVVGDQDASGPAGVSVSAVADTPGLLAAIDIQGTGANRTFRVVPAPDQFGSTRLTLFARDPEGLTSSTSLTIVVNPINDPPTLAPISTPAAVDEDSGEQVVTLTGISPGPDNESVGANVKPLVITAALAPQAGENPLLLTQPIVALAADGKTATLRYTPRPNQNGSLTIQVTVNDGSDSNAVITRSVLVKVRPVNDSPTIGIANPEILLTSVEGQTSAARTLILSDVDAAPGVPFNISARSLSTSLLADSDILISRPASGNPTVAIRGVPGKTGSGEIELTITGISGLKGVVRVPVLITHRPTIALLTALTGGRLVLLQDETQELRFLVQDAETAIGDLRFFVTTPAATELDPGPLAASGVELSHLGGGVVRALVTPNAGALGTAEVLITVKDTDGGSAELRLPVEIRPQPATVSIEVTPSATVAAGAALRLHAKVTGTGPFEFQWRKGEENLQGETGQNLNVAKATGGDEGIYTVVVRNPAGLVKASASIRVLTPPVIVQSPKSQTIALGQPLVLEVLLQGGNDSDVTYQWRKGGIDLPGETGPSLIRSSSQAGDAGRYEVVVTRVGTVSGVLSGAAEIEVLVDSLTLADAFVNATVLPGQASSVGGKLQQSGSRRANNLNATREVQEPTHASKTGGRSVWAKWTAPASGAMQISTQGSSFDTLLGVYLPTGASPSVGALELVVADDDGADAFCSFVEFNAVKGRTYYIAIDGRLGASGRIQLSWSFVETFVQTPDIVAGVVDVSARIGDEVVFSVVAKNVLTYQWYLNGNPLANQTAAEYRIASAGPEHVGLYEVVVSNGRNEKRSSGSLTLTTNPGESIADKSFERSLIAQTPTSQSLESRLRSFRKVSAAAASGFRGTQIYNTFGSTTEPGEPSLCGIIGGASQWSPYVAPSDGLLRVSTDGSNFDTLLGVFTGPADAGFEGLQLLACDDNGGANGRTSTLVLPVKAGQTYYIAVDGPQGQSGIVVLNYALSRPDIAVTLPPPVPANGLIQLTVPGPLGAKYVIQSSANLAAWRTILTTNAVTNPLRFRDPESATAPMRFYRLIRQN